MKNWKTTSAGIILIASSLIGLYFKIKSGEVSEVIVTGAITGIIGGIGLIYAKDAGVTGTEI